MLWKVRKKNAEMLKTQSQDFKRFKLERKKGRNIKTAKTRKKSAGLNRTSIYNNRPRLDKITDLNKSVSIVNQNISINDSSNSKL